MSVDLQKHNSLPSGSEFEHLLKSLLDLGWVCRDISNAHREQRLPRDLRNTLWILLRQNQTWPD